MKTKNKLVILDFA